MGLWSRIGRTFGGSGHRSEIEEELQFHLDMDVDGGRDRREARLRLGNVARIQEDTRAVGVVDWLESALRDARYGLRQLRRTPALTFAVMLSLAIGVGANTAIFSLVDAAILKPMPVDNPDSLAILEWTYDGFPPGVENINGDFHTIAGGRHQGSSVSAHLHRRLARAQTGFATIVGLADPDTIAMTVGAAPADQFSVQYVSANFFQGIGVAPIVGRAFQDDDDRIGAEPVVVVSHRFWASRLAASRDMLDTPIRVNTVPARIVGVAPPRFFGLYAGQWTDVYAPLAACVAFLPRGAPRVEDDRDWWVRQIARLEPDVPAATAAAHTATLFRGFAIPGGTPVGSENVLDLVTRPGGHGIDWVNANDARALWTLLMMVGVLMLIVCANVANLLLSRSVARQRESAMRLALGAARTRLLRQHLIESGILAALGGVAGLALGYLLAQSIHQMFQTGRSASSAFDLHIGPRIALYTAAISMLTAVLFGLVPAMRAARADLNDVLKAQARSVVGGRLRLPRLLVSLQIALSLGALVSAGLLARTLSRLNGIDIEFQRQNLAYVSVSPSRAGYSPERMGPYADSVRDELLRVPGVTSVSTVSFRVLSGMGNNGLLNLAGRPLNQSNRANLNSVGAGFFETLGIPVIGGRAFDARDIRRDAHVAVVDKAFVDRYFADENPLGRRFGFGSNENSRFEIVGVVGNSRYNTLRGEVYPTVYEPFVPSSGPIRFAIRSTLDPAGLADPIRRAVASVDPTVPVTEFHTQATLIDRLLRTERLMTVLSVAFGAIALTLAAVGLAGLLAYTVARRTNEIGVRMALGAASSDVVGMVLRDSLWMVGVGVLVGIPCAYSMARALQTTLFQVQPFDPWTAGVSAATLLTVAIAAACIPARRAAGIDPIRALRQE